MKKIAIVFLATCLLFASSRYVSHAGTSIPNVEWDLYISEEMVTAGVFCDPVNHRGNYEYQAYINHNKLYSNYYFKPQALNRYVLYGYEMYSVNQSYSYGLRRYVVGAQNIIQVSASETQFYHNFAGDGVSFGNRAYFFIDGTSPGATVSIYGTMETY